MLRIDLGNSWSTVTGHDGQELAWLRQLLSYEEVARGFGGVVKSIQQITLVEGLRFPSGLLPAVLQRARALGVGIEYTDRRVRPCEPKQMDIPWLAAPPRGEFQTAAVAAALRHGRGVIRADTGFGKTNCAIALGMLLPCNWVFLVDEIGLLDQTVERLRKFAGEEAGVIGAGEWRPRRFTVAMYQTLYSPSRAGQLAELQAATEGIIPDECYGLAAPKAYKTVMGFENAYFRVALSATAFDGGRARNMRIVGATGRCIYDTDLRELAEAGVVVLPEVIMFPFAQPEREYVDYNATYKHRIVRSNRRNDALLRIALREEKPGLFFVRQVPHGQAVLEKARKLGLRTEFLWSSASREERGRVNARVLAGELDLLIANRVYHKGIDNEAIRTILMGAGGKSASELKQEIGRGMRPQPGKRGLRIYDPLDLGNYTLMSHAWERKSIYEAAKYGVTLLTTLEELARIVPAK